MIDDSTLPSVTIPTRVFRALVGLALGYFCCSLTLLVWLLVLTIGYGDMSLGLERLEREWWGDIVVVASMSSGVAAWGGSFGGAAAFGACRARRGRTVFVPIASGAAIAAVAVAPVGAATAWVAVHYDPLSRQLLLAAPALAVPISLACGLLVGRHLTHSPTLLGRWRRVHGRLTLVRDDSPELTGKL